MCWWYYAYPLYPLIRSIVLVPPPSFLIFFSWMNTTDALTFVVLSACCYISVHYELISTFRFEHDCIFGIFVMIDFISRRWGLFR